MAQVCYNPMEHDCVRLQVRARVMMAKAGGEYNRGNMTLSFASEDYLTSSRRSGSCIPLELTSFLKQDWQLFLGKCLMNAELPRLPP